MSFDRAFAWLKCNGLCDTGGKVCQKVSDRVCDKVYDQVDKVGLWVAVVLLGLAFPAFGQSGLWQSASQFSFAGLASQPKPQIQADSLQTFNLNYSVLQPLLANVAHESTQAASVSKDVIALPMPDGSMAQFRFVESPVMEADLARKFPELKTYVGQGVDNPFATVRFDVTPAGFHAQILSPNGAVYLDPYYAGNTNVYACYFKRDYRRAVDDFQCFTADSGGKTATRLRFGWPPTCNP